MPREIFFSFHSPGSQKHFRTRKIISLYIPLGLHDFKTRKMFHCFLFHLGNMLWNEGDKLYIFFHSTRATILSNEGSVHPRMYFHTCNTLSSKVSIHECIKYCFPLRFPLHFRNTILEQAKCILPSFPLGLQAEYVCKDFKGAIKKFIISYEGVLQ